MTHSPNWDSDTWGYKATHWVIKRHTLGYKRHIGVFSPLNTRSRKPDTLDYCRLSTLALLLVNKVDLVLDHIQNYS